jgi:alpha-1,2-mannosyltransferase
VLLDGGELYGFVTPNGLPFTYPPFAALLAVPLAPLSDLAAALLWAVATVAALGWLVLRLSGPLREVVVERAGVRVGGLLGGGLLAMALWMQPLRDTLRFGQVGVLLAALVVADLTSRRPWWPRGSLIGLAAAVKLLPALFVVHLWLSGRRRASVVAVLTGALLTLVGVAVLPGESAIYWTSALWDTTRVGDDANGGNQSLRGLLVRAGLSGGALTALLVPLVAVLLVVGLRRAAALSRDGHEVAAIAVVGCLTVAVAPISWIHHLVWLVPAAVVLAGDLRDRVRLVLLASLLMGAWARLPWQAQAELLDGTPGRPLWLGVQAALGLVCVLVVLRLRPAR